MLEASAAHRLTLSPFRTLPNDILREICIACIDEENYPSVSSVQSMPHVLARISSRMRNVALTTPSLWSTFLIEFTQYRPLTNFSYSVGRRCARGAKEWLQRAGALALNISVEETNDSGIKDDSEISKPLFDVLLSYSTRWQKIDFDFASLSGAPLARLAALKASDVPLLKSLSLNFRHKTSAFHHGTLLTIPTLKRLSLHTRKRGVSKFSVNWANLTVLQICGKSWVPKKQLAPLQKSCSKLHIL